jgi:LCP family protein required for cell wall assembly
MQAGSFPLIVETFERNFAIHIDRYMMTNFSGFRAIVDTLGGIDIDASKNTSDRCDLSNQRGAWCSIGPGAAHLNGELALWYVRSRYTSSDFDRTRRAQEVMVGLFKKLMSLDAISRAPDIYNQFISSVETDLSLNDVLPILNIAPSILQDQSRIRRYAIGTEHVTSTITQGGAAVLLPNYEAIWQVIRDAVYTP